MLTLLKQAIKTPPATNGFPATLTERPDGYRGKPVVDFARCSICGDCATACPSGALAITLETDGQTLLSLDYGNCIFCGACEEACPEVIRMTKESFLATADRGGLVVRARFERGDDGKRRLTGVVDRVGIGKTSLEQVGTRLSEKIRSLFGRSLHIREVDAGSCNGCEIEITGLNNPVYDIERFGIHFVASPRHADMLLVTGPVTRNMEIALKQSYEATPAPKLVVAVGACAVGGGMFGKSYASCGGVNNIVPVDVYIPGCPPQPEALLQGILMAIERYPR